MEHIPGVPLIENGTQYGLIKKAKQCTISMFTAFRVFHFVKMERLAPYRSVKTGKTVIQVVL